MSREYPRGAGMSGAGHSDVIEEGLPDAESTEKVRNDSTRNLGVLRLAGRASICNHDAVRGCAVCLPLSTSVCLHTRIHRRVITERIQPRIQKSGLFNISTCVLVIGGTAPSLNLNV